MARFIGPAVVWMLMLSASTGANAAPLLQSIAPLAINFVYEDSNGFLLMTGTGLGDVTASLWAVDLHVPSPGGSTSGCEAADFAGFAAGSIALIQRGTCTFEQKTLNAQAAGAVGVLVFNEGNDPGRVDAFGGTLGALIAAVPVFTTSFGVGDLLRNGVLNGATDFIVRMKVEAADLPAVPEPGAIVLLGLGLAGFVRSRRRGRAR